MFNLDKEKNISSLLKKDNMVFRFPQTLGILWKCWSLEQLFLKSKRDLISLMSKVEY